MVSYRRIPTGLWQYYDNNQVLRVEGKYRVKKDIALPTGLWSFYDTLGEMVMTHYKGPKKPVITYLKPVVILTNRGVDVVKEKADGSFEVFHYVKPRLSQTPENRFAITDSVLNQPYDSLVAMDHRNPGRILLTSQSVLEASDRENLVPNFSFEENERGNSDFLSIGMDVNSWWASAGSPDYYCENAYHSAQGKASVGCRFYTERGNHIEFISAELNKPLSAGKKYCFQTLLKLKEESYYGVNAFGVLFSSYVPGEQDLIEGKIKPSLSHHGGIPLSLKTEWMQLNCIYTALGGETILTLGSFSNARRMQRTRLKGANPEAYYYLDAVTLFEVEDETQCPCMFGKSMNNPPETGKAFIIRNIFFNNDQWDILPASYPALDSLYTVFTNGPFSKIEISGHTSNTGSRERNIMLSQNRAQSVKNYLVNRGLNPSLFICVGHGPDKPIADNSTEKGRSENRRVEFKILE